MLAPEGGRLYSQIYQLPNDSHAGWRTQPDKAAPLRQPFALTKSFEAMHIIRRHEAYDLVRPTRLAKVQKKATRRARRTCRQRSLCYGRNIIPSISLGYVLKCCSCNHLGLRHHAYVSVQHIAHRLSGMHPAETTVRIRTTSRYTG